MDIEVYEKERQRLLNRCDHLCNTIINLEQQLVLKSKQKEILEASIKLIYDRFEDKQALHKDDCFAYQTVSNCLESLKKLR